VTLVLEERLGAVLRLTMNRPEKRNPLSYAMAAELVRRLKAAEADAEIGAIVLTGAGEHFCVGGDQSEFRAALTKRPPELLDEYTPLDLFKLGRTFRKPLIAAVGGPAMGGGFGVTCMAHVAIAADTATFAIPEIKLGIFPLTILPLIRPVIGDRRTLELAITGRTMQAAEALEVGLVQRVVAPDRLQAEALETAQRIAGYSPLAMRLGLKSFFDSADMGFEEAIEHLNAMRVIFFGSEDLNEGSTAFLEKRKPVWRGR